MVGNRDNHSFKRRRSGMGGCEDGSVNNSSGAVAGWEGWIEVLELKIRGERLI